MYDCIGAKERTCNEFSRLKDFAVNNLFMRVNTHSYDGNYHGAVSLTCEFLSENTNEAIEVLTELLQSIIILKNRKRFK